MKKKVTDYIADRLNEAAIGTIFTVVGGGAMHLNDSFGHDNRFHCIYQHHEQACSMAAEGYTKATGRTAAVCVTSGPGAINALNGVAGAYQDSIPMIVLSGQVKTSLMVRYSGRKLRTLGGQEFDIVSAVGNMTKYAEVVDKPERIRWCIEKAIYTANNGRPGPCWLDIPLDIQAAVVETEELIGYTPMTDPLIPTEITETELRAAVDNTIKRIVQAQRPVLYAGNGIRLSGAYDRFRELVEKLGIPVVTCWDSIDLIETDNKYYAGRGGTMGDRAGNFAIQNADLVIAIGNRLSIYQVGYNINTWAREAYVIDVDIDPEELQKPTVRIDLPICADANRYIIEFLAQIEDMKFDQMTDYTKWIECCNEWKRRYPVINEDIRNDKNKTNVYAFIDELSRFAGENSVTVASNGSASVVGSQTYYIAKGQRFILNCALSSMGYGLPSSIGASVGIDSRVICLEGDGSIQMNIQELQTVVTNKLPIKIFIINNEGYHQIRQTQINIFHNGLVGVGPESGDLEFPSFEKIAYAYDIPYFRIDDNASINETLEQVFRDDSYTICEVICNTVQVFAPKSATKKMEDGRLISPPLEDLAPFLPREELRNNMIIPLVED